jgi:sulfhydrogenase subunit delta
LPIEKYIEVDYKLRGCPIVGEEFLGIIKNLLAGKTLRDFEIPVCHECRLNNNSCLIERGKFCAGPITYFGCKAICPENNASCIGCRGMTKDLNLKSWIKKMKEIGFEEKAIEILKIFNQFNHES